MELVLTTCDHIVGLKGKRQDVVAQLKSLQAETELITKIFEDPEVVRQMQSSR
jgi:translation initiation factor 3 subunit E